jgi:Plasmid pRiA4b ORF-3-like protein
MPEVEQPGPIRRFRQPDDIFQVRVSLIDIDPPIWRRLLLPQDVTLPRLHDILQVAMGWTDSHLHQFKVGEIHFAEPHREFEPGPIDYRRIALNQIAPRLGSRCVYEYDFGDGWDHLIEIEAELPVETVAGPLPRCLSGERACPPEDCGGTHGYAQLLQAVRDPCHPEHGEFVTWVGADFAPEAFNLERVNRILARYAPRPRSGAAGRRAAHRSR